MTRAWTQFTFRCTVAIAALLLAGCGDATSSNHAGAPVVSVAANTAPETLKGPQAARVVADLKTFSDEIRPFLKAHCVECHGPEKPKGNLRLDTLEADFVNSPHAAAWVEVMDRINLGEMPPEDKPRPDAEKLATVSRWIASEVRGVAQRAQSTGGRPLLRRLTRTEYIHTVRDLLHVEFLAGEGPIDLLPPDGRIGGFDKVSKGLLLDTSLMDAYYRAAEQVADRALPTRPPRVPTAAVRFEFEDTARNGAIRYIVNQRSTILTDDGLIIMEGGARTFGVLRHPYSGTQVPVRGLYTVRVRAAADKGERGEPIYMNVNRGAEGDIGRFRVDAALDAPKVYEFTHMLDPAISGELQVMLANGTHFADHESESHRIQQTADAAHGAGRFTEAGRIRARGRAVGLYDVYSRPAPAGRTADLDKVPKLFLDYIEIEGPLTGSWPPASVKALFPDGLGDDRRTLDEARRLFERLLPRAYRRPVKPQEVKEIVDLVASEVSQGESFEEAVKSGIIATLCSPSFLYLVEPAGDANDPPRPLNDHELAARLSYLLWSSTPDTALAQAAAAGRLRDAAALDAQISRMLADPKAEALVSDFAAQWLRIGEFDQFKPDEQIYRTYYRNEFAGIGEDMKAEPLAFFREIMRSGESILGFIDSDWTMLNERLAGFYGVTGVTGKTMRRVKLPPDSPRGGLLGMAGFHKWGSDGNRTKPVHRGKYVLDVLFNDPPDPPPPNAGEIQPNERGKNLSVRERLEQHRQIESCGNCHRGIDPYGLALENFNAIGQWRTVQDGEQERWGGRPPAIDPSGKLPGGRTFKDVREFKRVLMTQQERFVRGLAEKLFIYATGRLIEPADRATIDAMTQSAASNGYTFASLLGPLIHSQAFRMK